MVERASAEDAVKAASRAAEKGKEQRSSSSGGKDKVEITVSKNVMTGETTSTRRNPYSGEIISVRSGGGVERASAANAAAAARQAKKQGGGTVAERASAQAGVAAARRAKKVGEAKRREPQLKKQQASIEFVGSNVQRGLSTPGSIEQRFGESRAKTIERMEKKGAIVGAYKQYGRGTGTQFKSWQQQRKTEQQHLEAQRRRLAKQKRELKPLTQKVGSLETKTEKEASEYKQEKKDVTRLDKRLKKLRGKYEKGGPSKKAAVAGEYNALLPQRQKEVKEAKKAFEEYEKAHASLRETERKRAKKAGKLNKKIQDFQARTKAFEKAGQPPKGGWSIGGEKFTRMTSGGQTTLVPITKKTGLPKTQKKFSVPTKKTKEYERLVNRKKIELDEIGEEALATASISAGIGTAVGTATAGPPGAALAGAGGATTGFFVGAAIGAGGELGEYGGTTLQQMEGGGVLAHYPRAEKQRVTAPPQARAYAAGQTARFTTPRQRLKKIQKTGTMTGELLGLAGGTAAAIKLADYEALATSNRKIREIMKIKRTKKGVHALIREQATTKYKGFRGLQPVWGKTQPKTSYFWVRSKPVIKGNVFIRKSGATLKAPASLSKISSLKIKGAGFSKATKAKRATLQLKPRAGGQKLFDKGFISGSKFKTTSHRGLGKGVSFARGGKGKVYDLTRGTAQLTKKTGGARFTLGKARVSMVKNVRGKTPSQVSQQLSPKPKPKKGAGETVSQIQKQVLQKARATVTTPKFKLPATKNIQHGMSSLFSLTKTRARDKTKSLQKKLEKPSTQDITLPETKKTVTPFTKTRKRVHPPSEPKKPSLKKIVRPTLTQPRTRATTVSIPKPSFPRVKPVQTTKTLERAQKLKPRTITTPRTPTLTAPKVTAPSPSIELPPLGVPGLPMGKGGRGAGTSFPETERESEYMPSVAAGLFGITTTKKFSPKKLWSGFSVRPIVKGAKK